jgi:DNA-binding response OmpR family regulator
LLHFAIVHAIDNFLLLLNNEHRKQRASVHPSERGGRRRQPILDIPMARILCVDDERHAAKLKCIILETAGHKATPATSAREAIALLQSSPYDLVVTDWRLGDASGRDIVVAARQLTDTPVVVISGYVNEAFQAPDPLADFYLEKPVNPEELIRIVNDLVRPAP